MEPNHLQIFERLTLKSVTLCRLLAKVEEYSESRRTFNHANN